MTSETHPALNNAGIIQRPANKIECAADAEYGYVLEDAPNHPRFKYIKKD